MLTIFALLLGIGIGAYADHHYANKLQDLEQKLSADISAIKAKLGL